MPVAGSETIRLGWAKIYADGALGSRTAAVFDPYPGTGDRGILRLDEAALHAVIAAARDARIAVAIHAIGDRAVATALDALGHAARRHAGAPADRLEHLQLVRGRDLGRLATLDVTASVQPTHAASDRATADELWDGSRGLLYPWRSLADAGATLAFGSDAPIETADPWVGIFTAAHRRFPSDESGDWRTGEAVSAAEALAAYTIGPARAAGRSDEGHLRVGAVADLAVLNVDLETLLAADERLVEVRSELTMVAGREVPRARPAE